MLKTITIEVMNEKVLKLLEDLEILELIKVRKEKGEHRFENRIQLYKGAMSKQSISQLDSQLNELRNGWE